MAQCFIIDSTAFIGGVQELRAVTNGGECVTTAGVLNELKSPGLRAQVEMALPGLRIRAPGKTAVARATSFAKNTGDAAVLSAIDLELIALACGMMEERGQAVRDSPQPAQESHGSGLPGWVDGNDDDEGWLGPGTVAAAPVELNMLSSDFAVQNVCLQLGIPVLALDGRRVTQLRGYQLACDSCQHTTKQTTARFCPKCGHATLARLACEYNADGSTTFFRKRNRRVNLRGVRYPVPEPKGGRHMDLIVSADDLHKPQVRAFARQQRRENPWGVEMEGLEAATANVPVGYGRRNPNVSAFWKHKKR